MTWQMCCVRMECGPVVSRCACRIEGLAIAAAARARTAPADGSRSQAHVGISHAFKRWMAGIEWLTRHLVMPLSDEQDTEHCDHYDPYDRCIVHNMGGTSSNCIGQRLVDSCRFVCSKSGTKPLLKGRSGSC